MNQIYITVTMEFAFVIALVAKGYTHLCLGAMILITY